MHTGMKNRHSHDDLTVIRLSQQEMQRSQQAMASSLHELKQAQQASDLSLQDVKQTQQVMASSLYELKQAQQATDFSVQELKISFQKMDVSQQEMKQSQQEMKLDIRALQQGQLGLVKDISGLAKRQELEELRAETHEEFRLVRCEMRSLRTELKAEIGILRNDARADFRLLFGALITLAIGMTGLLAKAFHWI